MTIGLAFRGFWEIVPLAWLPACVFIYNAPIISGLILTALGCLVHKQRNVLNAIPRREPQM